MTTILCVSANEDTRHRMNETLHEDLGYIPEIVITSASPDDVARQVGNAFVLCADSEVADQVRKVRPDLGRKIKTLTDYGYSPGGTADGFRQAMTNASAEITTELV